MAAQIFGAKMSIFAMLPVRSAVWTDSSGGELGLYFGSGISCSAVATSRSISRRRTRFATPLGL